MKGRVGGTGKRCPFMLLEHGRKLCVKRFSISQTAISKLKSRDLLNKKDKIFFFVQKLPIPVPDPIAYKFIDQKEGERSYTHSFLLYISPAFRVIDVGANLPTDRRTGGARAPILVAVSLQE